MMKKVAGDQSSGAGKVERKTVEKNRRMMMKSLCYKLVSIIPDDHFNPAKEVLSQQDQLGQTIDYIRLLTEKIENLKKKKQELMAGHASTSARTNIGTSSHVVEGSNFPIMEIAESGSSLEVVLISGLHQNFVVGQVIAILEEEGAEVVNIGFSSVGDKIFHTFQAQVKVPLRVGVDTSRISERIRNLF